MAKRMDKKRRRLEREARRAQAAARRGLSDVEQLLADAEQFVPRTEQQIELMAAALVQLQRIGAAETEAEAIESVEIMAAGMLLHDNLLLDEEGLEAVLASPVVARRDDGSTMTIQHPPGLPSDDITQHHRGICNDIYLDVAARVERHLSGAGQQH